MARRFHSLRMWLELVILPGNFGTPPGSSEEKRKGTRRLLAHTESERDKEMADIAGHLLLEVELNSIYGDSRWHRDHVARPLSDIAFSAPVLRANQALHHSKIAIAEVQRCVGPNVHDSH
jgi:hypothetical protein